MQYTILMSCGHNELKNIIGKHTEREKKIKYYEDYGLCSKCYEKKKAEEKEQEDADKRNRIENKELDVRIEFVSAPFVDWKNDIPCLCCILSGKDTYLVKDQLKEKGYTYGRPKGVETYGSSWWKYVDAERKAICSVYEEINSMGAAAVDAVKQTEDFLALYKGKMSKYALSDHKRWLDYKEELKRLEQKKPVCPEIIKGKTWNGKIYKNAIYIDGEKVVIKDDTIKELEDYKESNDAYLKRKECLVRDYRIK